MSCDYCNTCGDLFERHKSFVDCNDCAGLDMNTRHYAAEAFWLRVETFWTAIAHERARAERLAEEAYAEGLRRGPGPIVRFPEDFGPSDGPVVDGGLPWEGP